MNFVSEKSINELIRSDASQVCCRGDACSIFIKKLNCHIFDNNLTPGITFRNICQSHLEKSCIIQVSSFQNGANICGYYEYMLGIIYTV